MVATAIGVDGIARSTTIDVGHIRLGADQIMTQSTLGDIKSTRPRINDVMATPATDHIIAVSTIQVIA